MPNIITLPKWSQGRQMTHYYKMLLFMSERFRFDIYLLKFPTSSYIKEHKDPAPEGYEHHRINIILNSNFRGGKFMIMSKSKTGRVHRFRPDKYKHKVTEVKEGTRYVLSIGWLKKIDERITR